MSTLIVFKFNLVQNFVQLSFHHSFRGAFPDSEFPSHHLGVGTLMGGDKMGLKLLWL